ncbi:MAG: molybdopterin molybdotransferase MoeA [Gordonia sp. (in: high G+C Gram-positive bacteria)]
MRTVSDHQQAVSALFGPPETALTPVRDALNLVIAADTPAPISMPSFDNSAMDGYAVRAADIADAAEQQPVHLPIVADIPAGRTDAVTHVGGTAARIMTGAPVPAGADTIVPVELTDGGFADVLTPDATVGIRSAVAAGKHIRTAGGDIEHGEVAIAAGTVIRAPQIGLLAALGIVDIAVFRPLRVAILSTGSELVAPGNPLRHGQIYESNGPMLTAAAIEAGAVAEHVHFVPDNTVDFRSRLDEVSSNADLIITSGGVSAGAYEVVKEALRATGTVEFVKVAMQPGMPQGSGHYRAPDGRAVPIITLPGNPVSALVSFEIFIRPPLRAAMGLSAHRPRRVARLTEEIHSPKAKRQFLRGVLSAESDGGWQVKPIGPPASHHLRYLAAANALIDVPVGVTELTAGTKVEVIAT